MMWGEAVSVLRARASSVNGQVDTASGPLPALTRQQAASVILGGVRVTSRNRMPWDGWYDLALPTLGHYADTDKFVMQPAYQGSKLDPPTTEKLWAAMNGLAADLDKAGVRFDVQDWTPSATRYDQLAKMAWGSMQARKGMPGAPEIDAAGIPLVPKPVRDVLKNPPKVPVPEPAPSTKSKLGIGLLVLGGLWWLSENKGRRGRRG